ncbi:DUF6713 family protein [Gloeocapsopsis sp. IPPAS B-1203]|uniref:DUF6713 family protein n=1 Tax=Gloeocapsopsis sp. IPPAS B-1203 TaxID=2049454 RepID=UPI000C184FA5|nr:DUF6713 family protein [Gloeocapsopsis sp. IPPAS B-1203]PIG91819.1 hypothetical protein CSQ79_19545 [Gloeocapsopsis sp. IPPAS B-1203]
MLTKSLSWLYLVNATILITHQIDAAYWHEWDLFRMPGGIQLNLLLNIPLVMLILFGQRCLTQGRTAGFMFSWLLVAGGIIAVSIHAYFLLQGDNAFRLPVSLGLLVTTFFLSLLQAIALLRLRGTLKLTQLSH